MMLNKIHIILFVSVLFLFCVFSLPAAEIPEHDSVIYIDSISIIGLGRTRLNTAERPLRKFIGVQAELIDQDEIWAAILDIGTLEPILVEVREQVLYIEVREKWAIIPIPLVRGGSAGGITFGLGFMDANAFGLSDRLIMGAIFDIDEGSLYGWSFATLYIHNSRGGHIPGWNSVVNYSREERSYNDQSNNVQRHFELDSISLVARLNIPLIPDSDFLTATPMISFNSRMLRENDNEINPPDSGFHLFGISAEVTLRKSTWDGYFLSQEEASMRYFYQTTFGGFGFHSVRFRGTWDKSLVPGFRFVSRTSLLFEPDVPIIFESPSSASGVDILPRDFYARHYAGASAGLEKSIVKIRVGTISIGTAYQAVYSESSILGHSFDHGVTGNLTFYINRLAIPAVSVGAAYNVSKNYFQGFFNLGVSF